MPHLQVLQDKYAKTGKFTVIGSHLQSSDPSKFLKSRKITFPNYSQLRHPEAPAKGIPHMVLIDHKGKVLKSGRVSDKEIEAAIKEAAGSSPMWDSVDVVHHKRTVKNLQIGKPVRGILSTLASKAKKDDDAGKEAKAIIDAVNSWGEGELGEINKLKEKAPTKAYKRMELLNKTFYGMPLVKELYPEMLKMKKDKYLSYLMNLRNQVDRLKASKKITENSKKFIAGNLQKFIDKYPASEVLKSEAKGMIEEVNSL